MGGSFEPVRRYDSLMKLGRLVRRGLQFHLRSHIGVLLGIVIGSAALTGALVVGDSVRETLAQNALARLGPAHFAIFSSDRLFQANLRQRMCGVSSDGPGSNLNAALDEVRSICPLAYGLVLPGVVARQDGSARANQVTIMGVEDPAWAKMASWEGSKRPNAANNPNAIAGWRTGENAFINETLARQLQARTGDEIVVRIRKPSALGMDAAISPKNDTTISIRLKVGAVLDSQLLGDFALSAGQTPPANLFLPYEVLRRQLKLAERANLMLMGPAKTQATVNDRLGREWLLEDAELTVHSIEPAPDATGGEHPQPVVEVSSPRIFLEDSVVSAALRPRAVLLSNHHGFEHDSTTDLKFSQIVTNGIGVLT